MTFNLTVIKDWFERLVWIKTYYIIKIDKIYILESNGIVLWMILVALIIIW